MARVLCTIDTARKKVEELQRKEEERRDELTKLRGKRDTLKKKGKEYKAGKVQSKIEDLAKSLKKLQNQLKRAQESVRVIRETEKKVLDNLGEHGLSVADLRAARPEVRWEHTKRRVVHEEMAGREDWQWRSIRKYMETLEDPGAVHPILFDALADYVTGPEGKKAKRVISTRKKINPNTVFERGITRANALGYEMDKAPTGKIGETRTIVRDKRSGREVEAVNDVHALLLMEELNMKRRVDPDLLPPGTPVMSIIEGPNAPSIIPPGRVRADGTRVKTSDMAGNVAPLGRIEMTTMASRFGIRTKEFIQRTGNKINAIRKEQGLEPIKLFSYWLRATERIEFAGREYERIVADPLKALLKKTKIKTTRGKLNKIYQARKWRDEFFEKEYQEVAKSTKWDRDALVALLHRQRTEDLPKVMEAMKREFRLDDTDMAFIRGMDDIYESLADYLNVPAHMRRVGFQTRLKAYAESFYDRYNGREPTLAEVAHLNGSIDGFYGVQERMRATMKEMDPEDRRAIEDQESVAAQALLKNGNALEVLQKYGRMGIHKKVTGDAISDIQRLMTFDRDAAGHIAKAMLGQVELGDSVAQRLRRELVSMMGLPQFSQMERNSRLRQKIENRMKKVGDMIEKVESDRTRALLPRAALPILKKYYRKMGIQLGDERIMGIWEKWTRLHRSKTFGLNPMASLRDTISTIMLVGIRFGTRDFARAMADVYLPVFYNPKKFLAEYRRQVDNGWLDKPSNAMAMPELDAFYEGRYFRTLDRLQLMYRSTDVGTRVFINRAAEIATKRAYKRYLKSKQTKADYHQFLQDSGLDLSPSGMFDTVWEELNAALKSGDQASLIRSSQRIHEGETAFFYARWNSSPFMDYAFGRAAGQYGSWSVNMVSTSWHLAMGPWRAYGKDNPAMALKRYAEVAAKFAIMAELTYSLGAAFDIDTSDWIPFPHNALEGLGGGPAITGFNYIREMLTGDPILLGMFESNPAVFTARMLREAVPGGPPFTPGMPNSVTKTIWQLFGNSDENMRQIFGVPEQRDEWLKAFYIGANFHTFQQETYPNWRQGGLPSMFLEHSFGPIRDYLSEWSGGVLAPGTTQGAQSFTPKLTP